MLSLRSSLLGLVVVGGLLAGCSSQSASPSVDAESLSYLFTVSGQQGTIDGIGEDTGAEELTLTLTGVNDHATQFADRPIRQAYVLSTADIVDRWNGWFADDPPNAVLSFTEPGDPMPHSIVVQLTDPVYDSAADTLAFTARHLHRQPDLSPHAVQEVALPRRVAPATFANATLFIDSVDELPVTDEAPPSVTDTDPTVETETPEALPTQTDDPLASQSTSQTNDPQDQPTATASDTAAMSEAADGDLGAAAPLIIGGCVIQPRTNCSGADLTGANLTGANLSLADLTGANLYGARLTGANLAGASLSDVDLSDVHLSAADLSGADLSGANLSGANLSRVHLNDVDLSGRDLSGVDLSCAWLTDATLAGATLTRANLSLADLTGADLTDANLSLADLTGADLSHARLTDATLAGATLAGANLLRADLLRADLSGVDLSGAIWPRGWTCAAGSVGTCR